MGKVKVRISVNKKNGQYKADIIDHADGASCSLGQDEGILNDIMAAEIPGFGGSDFHSHGETEDWKRYSSRFTQKSSFDEHSEDAFSEDFEEKGKSRQLDNGFGV